MKHIKTGPNGEKRPRDANSCAVMVGRIATGQINEKSMAAPAGLEPATCRLEDDRSIR